MQHLLAGSLQTKKEGAPSVRKRLPAGPTQVDDLAIRPVVGMAFQLAFFDLAEKRTGRIRTIQTFGERLVTFHGKILQARGDAAHKYRLFLTHVP